MSKMKKVLTMCAAYALTASIAIGGTVAYLQDDASDDNVMVLGNVEIKQHEYERVTDGDGKYTTVDVNGVNSYKLQEFTQDKPLYPIVGDPSASGDAYAGWDDTVVRMTQVNSYGNMQVFAGKNAQDKFVTVENTSKTAAYIRTLVAIEIGGSNIDLIGTSNHSTWTKNKVGEIVVKGNNYYVLEFIYNGGKLSDGSWRHENGVLPAGDTSYPSLSQVYLKSTATNADMEAIDGNDNERLDILVLSQAVQAGGFDSAKAALDAGYGVSNVENATVWFEGVPTDDRKYVSTLAELRKAFEEDGEVVLLKDIVVEGASLLVLEGKNVVLDMNGKTISASPNIGAEKSLTMARQGSNLTIKGNGTYLIDGNTPLYAVTTFNANVTIENGTFINKNGSGKHLLYCYGGQIVVEDGYFDSGYYVDEIEEIDTYMESKTDAPEEVRYVAYKSTQEFNNLTKSGILTVYGGTYVGVNPAWGDEGCMLPNSVFPAKGTQGGYLEGQTRNPEELMIPDGYTITKGETADGRITYTVDYSK